MDIPDFPGAIGRNGFARARRLAVEMWRRGLCRQLLLDADHLREFDAAGKGGRRKKSEKCSAETFRFARQTAETFLKFEP